MKLSLFLIHVIIPALFLVSSRVHASDATSPCNVPKDVSFCMHMMRTGTKFDEETENRFTGLRMKFAGVRVGSCDWKELDGKISESDCVERLYNFSEEQDSEESNGDMFLENTVRLSGRRCIRLCRRVCRSTPTRPIQRACNNACRNIADGGENFPRSECNRRCRAQCNSAPSGPPRNACRAECNRVI